MRKAALVGLALTGLGLGAAAPQDPPPPPQNTIAPPDAATAPLPVPEGAPAEIRVLVEQLADEGVTVDFERRRVEVRGAILLDRMNAGYPIEYLVVTEEGFVHEALVIVRCRPSRLNAAFLALGLEPGRTVRYEKREPPPPIEKLRSGEEREFDVIAPEGRVVDLHVRWEDERGEHLHPIEDLMRYVTNGESLPRRGFVYVGSRFQKLLIGTEREERFMADVEGNVVALYLSGFGSCLFDMNSAEGTESYLYDVNPDVCPERGTKVTLVFDVR